MENRFQTSFIPKRPVVAGANDIVRRKGPPSFLLIVGVLVFIVALAATGGLFLYKRTLAASNEQKKLQIEDAIRDFAPELTSQLTVLKSRIDSGKSLLGNHVAFSSVLNLLEVGTAKTVRFTDMTFTYTVDPVTREQKVNINMKGEAQTYAAVAFQSDMFSKNENLRNPVFSDLNLNDRGLVIFNVKADLNPKSILYKNFVSGASSQNNSANSAAATTVTGTTTPANSGASQNGTSTNQTGS